jgi:dTDP-4-dehydrorhamnose 3,5-epimerase
VIFRETEIPGAWVIELDRKEDERGWFARLWDGAVFAERGLDPRLAQASAAFNHRRGTVRGLHYQAEPYAEAKVVRCTRGAVYDVVVDLRSDSPTFTRWVAVELSAANGRMLYVPEGLAHGYQTLADETETAYFISEPYRPEAQRGVRWDDPAFGIDWPEVEERVISDRDREWPDFRAG